MARGSTVSWGTSAGTTHWLAGVQSMRSAQEKNPRFRAEMAGSAR